MFRFWIALLAAAVLAACAHSAAAQDSAAAGKASTTATTPAGTSGQKTRTDSTTTIAAISPAHARARVVIADFALLLIAVVLTYQLVLVLTALTREVQGGGAPAVESHWGGFGGGMGGWRVSPALSYVFAALLLAALVGSIATILDRRVRVVPSSGTAPAAPAPSTPQPAAVDTVRRDSIRKDSAANRGTATQPGGAPAPAAGASVPAS
jgi:hypothetical protein